jgi:nucleoside-diphosphate-sugar epimerase
VTGTSLEPVFEPARLGELERSVLDPTLAERALGFRAAVTVEDGLALTWAEGEGGAGSN